MTQHNSAQEKFIAKFSERVSDEVLSLNMINIEADDNTLKAMKLFPEPGTNCVWGLLVVCSKGLYFYVHPNEQAMFGMIRKSHDDEDENTEQFFDFQTVANLSIKTREIKWYNFFSGSKFILDVEFDFENNHYKCFFNSNIKAELLLEKINEIKK